MPTLCYYREDKSCRYELLRSAWHRANRCKLKINLRWHSVM